MAIRSALERILSELVTAKTQQFKQHPLATFIRNEFAGSVRQAIGKTDIQYTIEASAGAGVWASVPWLSILDPEVTNSTQGGFYPVYLFRSDGMGVYLSLNQGTTLLTQKLGSTQAKEVFQKRIESLRRSIGLLSGWEKVIRLGAETSLGRSYEFPNIGAKFYQKGELPTEEALIQDLKDVLTIYSLAKASLPLEEASTEIEQKSKAQASLGPIPKPFLLLAGISGTGKTGWVLERKVEGLDNVSVIPVRPDWHEPSDLLGYISRISGEPRFVTTELLRFLVSSWRNAFGREISSMSPFWLCLDEMNLAPVEQYFADYLSVLEQRRWTGGKYECPPLLSFGDNASLILDELLPSSEDQTLRDLFLEAKGIPLPPNLIVVGTVNMDETTHGFSRKVLDRALTIEFDEVDFGCFRDQPSERTPVPWDSLSPYTDANEVELTLQRRESVLELLEGWNAILDQTAFRIAYRTINESLLIAASLPVATEAEVLDWVIMSKLLPRLEGDEEKLRSAKTGEDGGFLSYLQVLEADWKDRFGAEWVTSKSARKLAFMQNRLMRSGYTSFWP